ncbi:MAG: PAS domain-containing protein [Pseudomonadota bacterium]
MSFDRFLDDHFPQGAEIDALRDHSAVVCLATPGVPVVYVSSSFEAHTGYTPEEAIGRGLSFLQGPESEPEAVEEFRRLISNGEAGKVTITNYRKDGSRFMHECELRPVQNTEGTVTHFIAIQRPL